MSRYTDHFRDRILQGISILDSEKEDWWEDVDLSYLDLSDPCRCILGQVYEDEARAFVNNTGRPYRSGYREGSIRLGLQDPDEACDSELLSRFGFDVNSQDYDAGYGYSELTSAWRDILDSIGRADT
jgi:hypothetical protein